MSATAAEILTRTERPRRAGWLHPSGLIGGVIVAAIALTALVAVFWTPYHALLPSNDTLAPMSAHHPFGTDEYGRDVLSRLMAGAKIVLFSGAVSVAIAVVAGVPIGLAAAAARGRVVDDLLMRLVDLVYAFPALLAAIVLAAAVGASTTSAMVAIGIASIPVFARVTRAGALQVLESEYVLAARAYRRSTPAILWRHVLPNIRALLIVQASLLFSVAILAEAGLSYLGVGTPPPTPSWGQMVEDAQQYLDRDPLLVFWPGIFIALAVLGFNLLGDGLRDVLDPRLRSTR
ncbi:MAG TPA: ABC transporter permease [Gaiellaceae bacterium]|nr:ABC transporter permease [Gaiellaceae bacterium]